MSVNELAISGRLGRDPEIKMSNDGNPICNFSVAVDDGYGDNKKTHWINCVAFKKTAENIQKFFSKGDMIWVGGKLTIDQWEKDGQKKSAPKMVVFKFEFFSSKDGGQSNQQPAKQSQGGHQQPAQNQQTANGANFDDDIPF